jgi:hypothetical protein
MIFYKKVYVYSYLQYITLLSILLISNCLHAEMAHGVGEYLYGPETSESKACELAQDKAKSVALISVMGESVSNEEQLYCKETSGKKSDYDCEYNSVKWSLIEGDLKSPINVKRELESKTGFKSCKVSLDVEIIVPQRKPDPNFDVKAKTNQTVFRVGDDLNLEVESTMPAYFAVFNWLPYENNQVIFVPLTNSSEVFDSYVLKKDVGGKFQFKQSFSATWSKAYKGDKKFYDEWVVVVVTKKPYKWLSSYDLDEFKTKLREIPNDERRIKRLGYQLSK